MNPQQPSDPQQTQQQTPTPSPSTPQPSITQPPQNTTPTMAASSVVAKKIHNSAQSVLALGIFLTVVLALALLGGLLSKDAYKATLLVVAVVDLVLSIGLIINGRKLKQATTADQALLGVTVGIYLTLGIVVAGVIASIVKKGGLGLAGFLSLVSFIYLFVIRIQLAKLAKNA